MGCVKVSIIVSLVLLKCWCSGMQTDRWTDRQTDIPEVRQIDRQTILGVIIQMKFRQGSTYMYANLTLPSIYSKPCVEGL